MGKQIHWFTNLQRYIVYARARGYECEKTFRKYILYLALHSQSKIFFCFVRHRQDSTSRRQLSGLFRTDCK